MRLLVALHHLELGGSPLNALDLAALARDRGHNVVVFSAYADQPGPVAELVRARGLRLELVRHKRESPERMVLRLSVTKAIHRIVVRDGIQLVHAYEIPMITDSFYGAHLHHGVPLVCTIYGEYMPWWLPQSPQLIVGGYQAADRAAKVQTRRPTIVLPPVDTDGDSPDAVDGAEFRRAYGLGTSIVVSIISRLDPSLKEDSIKHAIKAIRYLDDPRIRLVIAGGGPSSGVLSAQAEQVNAELGRTAVLMTGPLTDPRPLYAAADIGVGMGGSARRSMAFGKPQVVVGIGGWAKPFLPANAQEFHVGGFYGVGSGDFDPRPLAGYIRDFADQPALRAEVGAFGRQFIIDHYSLKAAAATLDDLYATASVQASPWQQRLREAARLTVCKTSSDGLPDSIKHGLRPLVRPFVPARS